MDTTSQNGTLLVPVANPETVERLLDTAIDIAQGRSMRIVVLHVVEVPSQLPLSAGDNLIEENGEEKQLLDDSVERATAAGVTAESSMRYARDVATGIVGAVDVNDADALLIGWRGRPRRRYVVLGSFIDRILGEAPCDVFVKRIRSPTDDITSVLVPVAGGPHGELAVELAGTIASQHEAVVQFLHIQQPSASETAQADAAELLAESTSSLEDLDISVDATVIESEHVAGRITDETANHDLTILGATREPFLRRMLVGSVAEGVGRTAVNSVILARRDPTQSESES
jgi:nucleotide-binding universal stress UspA family protein